MVGGSGKVVPYLELVCRVIQPCSQRTLTLEFIFLYFLLSQQLSVLSELRTEDKTPLMSEFAYL